MQALERELQAARDLQERLTASLTEGERTRRIAEQRAHAEQALRRDLARRLAESEQETERVREAMGELAAAEDRIRGLEDLLSEARRRSDEAEQLAAAAVAARARAEHQALQRPRPAPGPAPESARLRFERQLRARRVGSAARVPAEPHRIDDRRHRRPAGTAAPLRPAAAPVALPEPVLAPALPTVPGAQRARRHAAPGAGCPGSRRSAVASAAGGGRDPAGRPCSA